MHGIDEDDDELAAGPCVFRLSHRSHADLGGQRVPLRGTTYRAQAVSGPVSVFCRSTRQDRLRALCVAIGDRVAAEGTEWAKDLEATRTWGEAILDADGFDDLGLVTIHVPR